MITNEHTEEALSRACVQAIAAIAGLTLSKPEPDYGIDGTFNEVSIINRRRYQSGFSLHFQAKTATDWQQNGNKIIYDLKAQAYNDLVQIRASGGVPCILILLTLPREQERWLECMETRVTIGGGCYWYYPLSSLPTSNTRTKTIHISKQQLLTPDSVTELLNKVKVGSFYR